MPLTLFVMTGASASGKSTVLRRLAGETRAYVLLDADTLWRPEYDIPEDGYRAFRSLALRVAKNIGRAGRPVVLAAGGTPEQFEATPERQYFSECRYLALVCDDAVLASRLRARPAWRESGSPQVIEQERSFNRWLRENASTTGPPMSTLDTTAISEAEAARAVAHWLLEQPAREELEPERVDKRPVSSAE